MDESHRKAREKIFLKHFLNDSSAEVSDFEVAYFCGHPEEIDDFSTPLNIHIFFLRIGALFGIAMVGISKLLKFTDVFDFMPAMVNEFFIDLIFEIGVALIGAAVTAYMLGILLNRQQENASKWRSEIRSRIDVEASGNSPKPAST